MPVQDGRRVPLFELLLWRIGVQGLPPLTPFVHPSPQGSGMFVGPYHNALYTLMCPQKWNGKFFEDTTLTAVGLVVQLGHHVGDPCSNPTALLNLMVFDLSGAHRLVVQYCDCDRPPPKRVQLLRSRWFPATIERPSTAFAFDILDFFHKLQDQNKCNPFDFYHAIIQRTDAAGVKPEIVCHFSFCFIVADLIRRSPASLQRDYPHPSSLDPPPTPQARWCYTPHACCVTAQRKYGCPLPSC